MKVHLLYPNRDFRLADEVAPATRILVDDLGLRILFDAMSGGDRYLGEVVRKVVLAGDADVALAAYRLDILDDCIRHPELVRELYALAVQAADLERSVWGWSTRFADTLVTRSVEILGLLLGSMRRVRDLAAGNRATVTSDGFRHLFSAVESELDEAFLERAGGFVELLRKRDDVVVTASLGDGLRGTGFVLRRRVAPRSWRERIGLPAAGVYGYDIPARDESGATMLGELRKRALALAADAVARSSDHVVSFFGQLRAELGFYVACLNAREALARLGQGTCRPVPLRAGERALHFAGLYDACMRLVSPTAAIGNDLEADTASLVVVTGANRGGKSTFLRSLGVAQLMMQAGMFVAADTFSAPVRPGGLFTHFRREEDATLRSGKLDEELGRLSGIVDAVRADGLVLMNESFASTNEREGAQIGHEVIRALLDTGVVVVLVTHVFELASVLLADAASGSRFLRAERLSDGTRTFRIVDGEPQPTSHGGDLYGRVFASPA